MEKLGFFMIRRNEKVINNYGNKAFDYKKIMFISYQRLSDNKYKLKYALDFFIDLHNLKSLFIDTLLVDYNTIKLVEKLKFGIWHDKRKFKNPNNYYYVYLKPNKTLFFKSNKYDNNLRSGHINSYNHKLLYKFFISEDYKINLCSGVSYE